MAQLETPPSPEALAAAVGRPPEPQLDPRAGYVVDLVSTLLVELIALTAQTKANGGRLKQNLLIRMLYNAREEWAAMLGKILRRTIQIHTLPQPRPELSHLAEMTPSSFLAVVR